MPQKHRWSVEENKEVLYCYYAVSLSLRGYRVRLYDLWSQRNPERDVTEQRLADQALSLLRRNVFTSVELQYLQQQASSQSDLTVIPSDNLESCPEVLPNSSDEDQNEVGYSNDMAATWIRQI